MLRHPALSSVVCEWKRLLLSVVCVVSLGATVWAWQEPAAPRSRFDRLSDEDRAAFSKRFEKEVWPLLSRNDNDGCVGCHNSRQNRGGLKFTGKPDADFQTLLKKGFLLPKDPGSVLYTVSSKDSRRRMPPGEREAWTAKEVEVLRGFVTDLDQKQKKDQ